MGSALSCTFFWVRSVRDCEVRRVRRVEGPEFVNDRRFYGSSYPLILFACAFFNLVRLRRLSALRLRCSLSEICCFLMLILCSLIFLYLGQ